MKNYFLMAFAAMAFQASAQEVITSWNFDDDSLDPQVGVGTISLIGGITGSFAAGATGLPDKGFNTATYPAQSENSGTAGIEIAVSTAGKSNIGITFQHRSSGTGSRFAQFEYSVDGTNWIVFGNNDGGISPHDSFYDFAVDLTSCAACNNNPNFKFKIVSIFSPMAFNQNATLSYGANEAYMRSNAQAQFTEAGTGTGNYGVTGTWRFDNVTFIENFDLSANSLVKNNFVMYPNPAKDFVQFSEVVNVEVYDVTGKKVFQVKEVEQINVSTLESGLYFVNINGVTTQKLMVK
ncbi:MAG: T9SS type A sorting domain-containing protein [Flavobacterium sp.]